MKISGIVQFQFVLLIAINVQLYEFCINNIYTLRKFTTFYVNLQHFTQICYILRKFVTYCTYKNLCSEIKLEKCKGMKTEK